MSLVFSVIINTYNYGRFIEACIDSVLAQDFPADRMEVLVVDDGSTDDTAERVKKYGDRVRYLYKENGDQCSAITFGAARARGDFLAFLDGDDLWLPNKLTRVAAEFAKESRTVMVYDRLVFWDSRSNSVWDHDSFTNVSGDVLADRRKLLTYVNAPTSALVLRRESFQRLTNIPMNRAFSYDLYLAVAALFLGPVGCIPEPLTKYRVHGANRHFAGRENFDRATIRRRIGRQEAAMQIIRNWVWANAPESLRPQARILLRRWRLNQENDRFLLDPPGRIRLFRHQVVQLYTYGAIMTPSERAYKWIYAFAALIAGKHAHYLEGVRTRAKYLTSLFRQRSGVVGTH